MLRSLTLNGQVPDVSIHIIPIGLRPADKATLELAAGRPIALSAFDKPTLAALRALPTHHQYNISAWAPIAIPNLTQLSGRAIILDADMIVNGSLRELFEIDLDGHPVGAVQDPCSYEFLGPRNEKLGRPANAPYFNAGTIVVDIGKWRDQRITERSLAWASTQTRKVVRFPDQDVLNKILGEDWKPLDLRWNFHQIPATKATIAEYEAANIVHFIEIKPNYIECTHPAKHLYFRYRNNTSFAKRPLLSRSHRHWRKRLSQINERINQLRTALYRIKIRISPPFTRARTTYYAYR